MSNHVPETCICERCSRTSFNLGGPARPPIYTVKQQHISAVEKKLKETIWKTRENNENRIAYSVDGLSDNKREKVKCSKSNVLDWEVDQ